MAHIHIPAFLVFNNKFLSPANFQCQSIEKTLGFVQKKKWRKKWEVSSGEFIN